MRIAPARLLVAIVFVDALGTGTFAAVSVVFFQRHSHVTGTQLGLALSIGGVAGLVVPSVVTALVDRLGTKVVAVAVNLLLVPAFLALILVRGFGWLVAVLAIALALQRCNDPIRRVTVTELVPHHEQMRLQAMVRTASNGGIAIGALAAVPALVVSSDSALVATVAADALTFLLAAGGSISLPARGALVVRSRTTKAAAGPLQSGSRLAARAARAPCDPQFVVLSVLMGALGVTEQIILVGIPLLVLTLPHSLHALIGVSLGLNTVVVLTRQLAVARDVETLPDAFRSLRIGAAQLAAGCLLLGLAAVLVGHAVVAAPILLVSVIVLSLSEVRVSAAASGVFLHTSGRRGTGRSQAVLTLGVNLRNLAGPLLVAFVAADVGAPGWLVLAAVCVTAIPVTRCFRGQAGSDSRGSGWRKRKIARADRCHRREWPDRAPGGR